MIHSGQEFARSKVISKVTNANDSNIGKLDHNSYEKDNETNYINYEHAKINEELLSYYKGLIQLRNTYEAFRRTKHNEVKFYKKHNKPFLLNFELNHKKETYFIVLNTYHKKELSVNLPEGNWEILVNEKIAGIKSLGLIEHELKINPLTGYILRKV